MKTKLDAIAVAARLLAITSVSGILLSGCWGDGPSTNFLPTGITQQGVTVYPATTPGNGTTAATQDLLTAGLGKTGIGGAAPTYVDPLAPTALELRRNAIYSNYRGLVDFSAAGGYGTLYGPNVDVSGTATASEGLIPGREYIATLDDGSGRKNTVIAVQIPDSFNPAAPCLVLGPSSGSRGVYGAVAAASAGQIGDRSLRRHLPLVQHDHPLAGALDVAQEVRAEHQADRRRAETSAMRASISSRPCGSRPFVGSSRRSRSGSCTRAWASFTRCFMPVEYVSTSR